jgi:hypothetical protein
MWAQGAFLGLMLVSGATAMAQGIIHVTPQQPIYYGPNQFQTSIDINGDGVPDFTLFGPAPGTSVDNVVLAPLGDNSVIAIPEPPPDLGYLVAALNQGTSIGSSLDPILGAQWYNNQTDQFGYALIGAMATIDNQISVIGYFAGQPSAYAGFDLYYNGANHYGWLQIANPLPVVAGQVVDWAYESSANTPILAGAGVPEPGAAVQLVLGLAGVCWSGRNGHGNQRMPHQRRHAGSNDRRSGVLPGRPSSMTATPKAAMWARGAVLALMLALFTGSARAQGTIVYVVPQQPIYYGPVIDQSTDIDLNGDGVVDYTLISQFGETDLQPHGQNSMVVVPEPPPDYGSFVAPLVEGDVVNPTPSSLNPVFAWFDSSTDPFGYSLIAAMNTAGPLGYFFDGIHYVGLEFESGGNFYYGWMEIDSPSPDVAYGQVLGWAYETTPNTPIPAGAVPEPSTLSLLLISGAALWLVRNRLCQSER